MGKSLISLDMIALGLCDDIGDSVGKNKFRFTRYLIDAYSEVHNFIGTSYSIKTAVLDVSNTIEMPCDFIRETKVGIRYKGVLAVLHLSNNSDRMTCSHTETEQYLRNVWFEEESFSGYCFHNAYKRGNFLGELYGSGRCISHSGFYEIDRGQGIITVGSLVPRDAEIVVEYKSDGVSQGLQLIPREMKAVLEFYAKSQYYADKNPSLSLLNESRYKKAYNKLQRMYNWEDALYATAKINEMFSPTNY